MTALSTGASMLAHSVHYAVVGAGLLGLVLLLGPRFAAAPRRITPDAHDLRVQALREQLRLGGPTPLRPARLVLERATPAERSLLPFAVVCSAAAAGVHAAVGPAHVREQTLFGLFFAGSALLQLLWSVAVVVRASRAVLVAGVAGNLAVVALWALTRTYGLPWGLLSRPEAVGPWDVACALWELGVAAACMTLLRSRERRWQLPSWVDWSGIVRGFALGSAVVLLALSFSGASA